MITKSIAAIKDRLVQVEDRSATERRRKDPYPAVVDSLWNELAALRDEMWALRRERRVRVSTQARP
ncbi:MAG: hypothetical protein ACOYKM_11925 [Caulobacterales bacterium]